MPSTTGHCGPLHSVLLAPIHQLLLLVASLTLLALLHCSTAQLQKEIVPRAPVSVYIYNTKENAILRELSSCTQGWRHGQWGTELAWHWYLLQSPYRTDDPSKADLFFVPIYPKCVSMYKGDAFLSERFATAITQLPYFQLSGGEDHIFVFPSGAGPTFFTKWREYIPNSIFFVAEAHYTDRVQDDAPYISIHKDVVIPGMIGPEQRVHKLIEADRPAAERTALATYFGRDQGKYTRKRIQDLSKQFPKDINAGFVVKDAYINALGNSKFCLVPRGQSSWTLRTYEAILTGCIPVILSDYARLPYERWIDFNEFTIKWPEKQTDESLVKYLKSITDEQIDAARAKMARVKCLFVYNMTSDCSAYHAVMAEAAHRVRRFRNSPYTYWKLGGGYEDWNHVPLDKWPHWGPFSMAGLYTGKKVPYYYENNVPWKEK